MPTALKSSINAVTFHCANTKTGSPKTNHSSVCAAVQHATTAPVMCATAAAGGVLVHAAQAWHAATMMGLRKTMANAVAEIHSVRSHLDCGVLLVVMVVVHAQRMKGIFCCNLGHVKPKVCGWCCCCSVCCLHAKLVSFLSSQVIIQSSQNYNNQHQENH